jgi:RNA polymerase sigma-70 factor (ECF subfamily)
VRFFALRTGSDAQGEDVVQDIWLRLEAMDSEAAAEVRSPAAFLYRLGSNLMLDRVRSRRRGSQRDDAWAQSQVGTVGGEVVTEQPSAEDAVWARLKLGRVIVALESLPEKTREAFRLHKLEGLSHAETAEAMGVSRSAVEKYVSATLKHLLREVGWP